MSERQRVLVAMSGGVDSSVAAALLKMQGYEAIGIHMQLWDHSAKNLKKSGGSCCSVIDAEDARRVCEHLEIPFYVINAREQFEADVIDYFVHEYLQARTPNPCVMCNNKLKFSYLLKKANDLKCEWVATGHYAKVVRVSEFQQTHLYKATDKQKDQSYFLFGLKQPQLSRALMPIGDLLKSNVRKLAQTFHLPVADKKDSQEICFIDEGGYKEFIEKRTTNHYRRSGPIVEQEGTMLGRHTGLYQFTIGQRKGLGFDREEYKDHYVIGFDLNASALIVGPEKDLYKSNLIATNCNWIGQTDFAQGLNIRAKIRSRHTEATCKVTLLNNDSVLVEFAQPQRAITAGQAIAFYQDEQLLGGGWIETLTEPVKTKITQARF